MPILIYLINKEIGGTSCFAVFQEDPDFFAAFYAFYLKMDELLLKILRNWKIYIWYAIPILWS